MCVCSSISAAREIYSATTAFSRLTPFQTARARTHTHLPLTHARTHNTRARNIIATGKERMKWEEAKKLDITAVIVVAALDDYAKTLVEDATRNRMEESLLLFKLITAKHFKNKPIAREYCDSL